MRRLTSTGLLKSDWKHTCVGSGALKDTLNKQDFLPPPPQKCHQVFKKYYSNFKGWLLTQKWCYIYAAQKWKKWPSDKFTSVWWLNFCTNKNPPTIFFFSKAILQGGSTKSCQRLPDCVLINIWSLSTLGFRTIELWFCLLFTTMHENKPL